MACQELELAKEETTHDTMVDPLNCKQNYDETTSHGLHQWQNGRYSNNAHAVRRRIGTFLSSKVVISQIAFFK